MNSTEDTVGHEFYIERISPLNFFLILCDMIALNLTISELQTKLKNSNYDESYNFKFEACLGGFRQEKNIEIRSSYGSFFS